MVDGKSLRYVFVDLRNEYSTLDKSLYNDTYYEILCAEPTIMDN